MLRRCGSRAIALYFTLLTAAVVSTLSQVADADRRGFENLDHVIDAQVHAAVKAELSLSEEQASRADELFAPYLQSVQQVDRDMEAALEQIRAENTAIRALDDPEQMRLAEADFNTRINRLRSESFRRADELLLAYYAELKLILVDEQRARLPDAKRLVRRMNWLDTTDEPTAAPWSRYFDLNVLLDEASKPGGELEPIRPLQAEAHDHSGDLAATWAEIADALETYELRIDDALAKIENARRHIKHVAPGESTGLLTLQQRANLWCSLFNVTDDSAKRIAAAVEAGISADVAKRWQLRYWRAWDDSMFADLPLHALDDWLDENCPNVTAEQGAAINELFAAYVMQLHDDRREIFIAAALTQCRHRSISGDEKEHVDLARARLRAVELHDASVRQISAAIPAECVDAFFDAFDSSELRRNAGSNLPLHERIELGFVDPAQVRFIRYNAETGKHERWCAKRNPETGRWEIAFESELEDR